MTEVHRFLDERRAFYIHRFELGEINQNAKTGLELVDTGAQGLKTFFAVFATDHGAVMDLE
jgi:hypothetical protein